MHRRTSLALATATSLALGITTEASVNHTTTHGAAFNSLDSSISNTDLIQGQIATELPGDLGWHPVNTNPADQLAAFTDGLGELGRNLTGLLNDFPAPGEAPKLVEYNLGAPANVGYINIFTGNIDHDERAFSTVVVKASTDGSTFNTVGYWQSDPSGTINQAGNPVDVNIRSTRSSINFTAGELDGIVALQFELFSVGNTQGQMRDPFNGVNPFTGFDDMLTAAFVSPKVYELDVIAASVSRWDVDADGDWPVGGNWIGGAPNAAGQIARFGGVITSPRTVTVTSPQTVGAINFDNAVSYTVAGASAITLDQTFGPAAIDVLAGTHSISASLTLNDNVVITVAAGSGLTLSGAITTNNRNVRKAGDGLLATSALSTTAGLNIDAGTVRINAGAGNSTLSALTIAGGATPTATMDLTNNSLVIDYTGASPFATVRAQVVSAYNGGAWNGAGITSSNADASSFAIGLAEASSLPAVPAIFGTVDGTSVLLRHTRYGDANLDGSVDLADFNRLAGNFGSTTARWFDGDFTYDMNVDLSDFNRLAANFGLSASPGGPTPQDWANLASAVPEPAVLGWLAAGWLLARRRRALCP